MGRVEHTVSRPSFIADPNSITRNQGRQANWAQTPDSYKDANGNKVIKPGTIVSMKGGGFIPRKNASQSITGITRSSQTATATKVAHGYQNGDVVTISGATQTEYNGDFIITVTGADTFTFTVAGSPATPATGTIIATSKAIGILESYAHQNSQVDAKTGYGIIIGGVVFGNQLTDSGEGDFAAWKTELQSAGTGFAFETYQNTAAN